MKYFLCYTNSLLYSNFGLMKQKQTLQNLVPWSIPFITNIRNYFMFDYYESSITEDLNADVLMFPVVFSLI